MNKKNNIRDVEILIEKDSLYRSSSKEDDGNTYYDLLFKATQEGIWEYNIETQKAFYNDRIYEIFGYSQEEMVDNRSWWQNNIHPGDKQRIISDLHNLMNGSEKVWWRRYSFRSKNGE